MSRTDLITDENTLRLVDKELAEDAARFGPLSLIKTKQAVDTVVDRFDPGALRRTRVGGRGREVVIHPADDQSGTATPWGSLFARDVAVLDRRLLLMAMTCVMTTRAPLPSDARTRWGRWPREPSDSRAAAETAPTRRRPMPTSLRRCHSRCRRGVGGQR